MFKSIFILSFALSICLGSEKVRYDNHKVIRIDISNLRQLRWLKNIENYESEYKFFEPPSAIGTSVNLVVPPHKLKEINANLDQFNVRYETVFEDLQAVIDAEKVGNRDDDFNWNAYFPLDNIYQWVGKFALENSKYVTPFEIGKSYEGRPILGVKISYKEGNPGIFIETNIHAREWITSATVTWIMNELLNSNDTAVRDIAENIDWYIIPVLNVDGFEFSHTSNRLWRKTRRPTSSLCYGVDGNRNFEYLWFTGGSSNNPCSDTYAGPNAFSEPETKALAQFYDTIHQNITAYLSFHSYGQYLLYTYGSPVAETVNNEDEHIYVANATITKLAERYGTKYVTGSTLNALYECSGLSTDWAKGVYDVPFSFTYEFRDNGATGFLLPADQIIPNAEETLDSLVEFVAKARDLGYFKK
uniref:Zinc carboxypeptidase A 1 n=1 Tax=Culicoides sonorensis TaxID=179676 RepID=A0A336MSM3_CULSO